VTTSPVPIPAARVGPSDRFGPSSRTGLRNRAGLNTRAGLRSLVGLRSRDCSRSRSSLKNRIDPKSRVDQSGEAGPNGRAGRGNPSIRDGRSQAARTEVGSTDRPRLRGGGSPSRRPWAGGADLRVRAVRSPCEVLRQGDGTRCRVRFRSNPMAQPRCLLVNSFDGRRMSTNRSGR
jgi:hypothetical protein